MNRSVAADRMESIVESRLFHRGVIVLIFLNAIIVGLETYPDVRASYGGLLDLADQAILYLFTLELALRFFATPRPPDFFRNGWNLFDLIIVGVSFLPASEFFTVARLFRVLRVMRAVSVLPDLQRLVAALLRSLPSLGHISLLLVLLIYVYAAIGTSFFADALPQYFGSLHRSVLTLFGVITLEGWVGLMEELLPKMPWAWLYFVTFILAGTFVALNFFVGIIVNNLQSVTLEEQNDLAEIRKSLARMEERLNQPPRGDALGEASQSVHVS
jgi:voltage-gated sodium channel